MLMELLRYDGFDIVMQEVPDEITLAINVTECPYHCVGCHSPHLWGSYGAYLGEDLAEIVQRYDGMITCVCFMGGDHHIEDLARQCRYIKTFYPHLKIAVYSGADNFKPLRSIMPILDYVKIGPYIQGRGGLDNPNTNQRLYKRYGVSWSDITYRFWRDI